MQRISIAAATAVSVVSARYTFAECRLSHNPANPKDWPVSGYILLAQNPQNDAMWMRVEADGLTEPLASFGMSINYGPWNGSDCSTAGGHWDINNGEHAHPSEPFSHTGDLPML